MAKKLTVRRNESSTYEVHLELGDPPKQVVGGLSLNLEHLRTELSQHGCPTEMVVTMLEDVQSHGSATVTL